MIRINIIIVCKFAFFKRANLIVASYKDNDLWIYEVASKQKGVVYSRFKLNWILELFILCKIPPSWPCRRLCEFFLWWSLKPWHRILVYCTQVNNQFGVNMLRRRKNHFYLISFLIACQITGVGWVLGFMCYAVTVLLWVLKIDVFLSRRRLVNKQFPRPFRLQVLIITYLSY